jgi:hypothetical protein
LHKTSKLHIMNLEANKLFDYPMNSNFRRKRSAIVSVIDFYFRLRRIMQLGIIINK